MKYQLTLKSLLLIATCFAPTAAFSEYAITTLALDDADQIIETGQKTATGLNVNVCMAIVDPAGILISFKRMDHAPYSCVENAIQKALSAALYRKNLFRYGAC